MRPPRLSPTMRTTSTISYYYQHSEWVDNRFLRRVTRWRFRRYSRRSSSSGWARTSPASCWPGLSPGCKRWVLTCYISTFWLCVALRLHLDVILRYVSSLGLWRVVLHIANNGQIFVHIRSDFCESLKALIKKLISHTMLSRYCVRCRVDKANLSVV